METGKYAVVAVVGSEKDAKAGFAAPQLRALRDKQGKLCYEITIPNAERLDLPNDLGMLLLSIGWGIGGLGYHLSTTPSETFSGCCEVISKLEAFLKAF